MTSSACPSWSRFVRFVGVDGQRYMGEPVDVSLDVGRASREGRTFKAKVLRGDAPWDAKPSGEEVEVKHLICPLLKEEVNTIRCLGLNYVDHAKEAKLDLPTVPTLFHKPRTALAGPWPEPVVVPKHAQNDQSDYESELCIVIGKDCRDVSEEEAMDYVLGFTASNDISARKDQFATSQWSRSKGYDSACPIGPCIVSTSSFVSSSSTDDIGHQSIKGRLNGKEMQSAPFRNLVFGVRKTVAFLSQGTTLERGNVILTGTPAGVGTFFKPNVILRHGDVFEVEISGGIGTLVSEIKYEGR